MKTNRTALTAAVALAALTAPQAVAFANEKTPAVPPVAPKAPTAGAAAPTITLGSAAIALPERKNNRGSESKYPFAQLAAPVRDEAGNVTAASYFDVSGKDAKTMSTIVSNQNRKHMIDKTDAAGNVMYKTKEITGADGVKQVVPDTTKPERVSSIHYVAHNIEGGVRIFRDL